MCDLSSQKALNLEIVPEDPTRAAKKFANAVKYKPSLGNETVFGC